jgi:hypothetical protein
MIRYARLWRAFCTELRPIDSDLNITMTKMRRAGPASLLLGLLIQRYAFAALPRMKAYWIAGNELNSAAFLHESFALSASPLP